MQMYDTFQMPQGLRKDPASVGKLTPKSNNHRRFYNNTRLISEQGYLGLNEKKYYDASTVIEFHLTD